MIERGGVPALEKVILELVEFDRQAQKAVRAAEERSASERARIVQEKEALSARYRERAQQTIQKLEHRKRQEAELELQKLEARYGDSCLLYTSCCLPRTIPESAIGTAHEALQRYFGSSGA